MQLQFILSREGENDVLNTVRILPLSRQQPGTGRMECVDKIEMVSLGKILWYFY